MIALKGTKIGDELFFDHNRDVRCPICNTENGFFDNFESARDWCNECKKEVRIGVMNVKKKVDMEKDANIVMCLYVTNVMMSIRCVIIRYNLISFIPINLIMYIASVYKLY